ncbi:hypothetical protein OM428_07295 [Enterococcus gallinarum]|nr:hypothetical protein [Enterococcus gallinarum]
MGTKNRRIVIEGSESQIRYFGHSFFGRFVKAVSGPTPN